MYADGIIGNLGILNVLGTLTAGQFNKMLATGKKPYTLEDIIPTVYNYLYPPLTEEDKRNLTNQNLLAFLASQPGAPKEILKEL